MPFDTGSRTTHTHTHTKSPPPTQPRRTTRVISGDPQAVCATGPGPCTTWTWTFDLDLGIFWEETAPNSLLGPTLCDTTTSHCAFTSPLGIPHLVCDRLCGSQETAPLDHRLAQIGLITQTHNTSGLAPFAYLDILPIASWRISRPLAALHNDYSTTQRQEGTRPCSYLISISSLT